MDLYTAIVVITMALLVVNIVDVCTDRLADKTATIRFITVCVVIGLAQMGEWIGVKTNGAEPALIGLHWFAKTVEFCMAPVMCVMAAHTYSKARKPAAAIGAIVVNALFMIVSNQYGWVFYIDEMNVYHRGRLYWVHVAVFIFSILYCFMCDDGRDEIPGTAGSRTAGDYAVPFDGYLYPDDISRSAGGLSVRRSRKCAAV